jgi:hypothetical protein
MIATKKQTTEKAKAILAYQEDGMYYISIDVYYFSAIKV